MKPAKSNRKRNGGLERDAAMEARPHLMPGLRTEEEADGSINVLIRFQRSKWQKWLGAPPEYERKYQLDTLGREVLDACDGGTSVRRIIAGFAAAHSLNVTEAEIAVTKYLKTLMMKRVIGMAVSA